MPSAGTAIQERTFVRFNCIAKTICRGFHWRTVASLAGATLLCACAVGQPAAPLKVAPGPGTIRTGDMVYVDDGSCPTGQIARLFGGNQKSGAPRRSDCVKRPDGL